MEGFWPFRIQYSGQGTWAWNKGDGIETTPMGIGYLTWSLFGCHKAAPVVATEKGVTFEACWKMLKTWQAAVLMAKIVAMEAQCATLSNVKPKLPPEVSFRKSLYWHRWVEHSIPRHTNPTGAMLDCDWRPLWNKLNHLRKLWTQHRGECTSCATIYIFSSATFCAVQKKHENKRF